MAPFNEIPAGEILLWAGERLRSVGAEEHEKEALFMLAHLLRIRPAELKANPELLVSEVAKGMLMLWIERRAKKEPLQYILEEAEFMGHGFVVGPDVLIPRPETEHLVYESVKLLREMNTGAAPLVLDLCAGSGCVAVSIALEMPTAKVLATDVSPGAVSIAVQNALVNGVFDKVECLEGDLFSALAGHNLEKKFDLVVSNPPYIATGDIDTLQDEVRLYEPRHALDGGEDGLRFVRKIVKDAHFYVRSGGYLLMEIGKGQSEAAMKVALEEVHYSEVSVKKDYSGIERILIAKRR